MNFEIFSFFSQSDIAPNLKIKKKIQLLFGQHSDQSIGAAAAAQLNYTALEVPLHTMDKQCAEEERNFPFSNYC